MDLLLSQTVQDQCEDQMHQNDQFHWSPCQEQICNRINLHKFSVKVIIPFKMVQFVKSTIIRKV